MASWGQQGTPHEILLNPGQGWWLRYGGICKRRGIALVLLTVETVMQPPLYRITSETIEGIGSNEDVQARLRLSRYWRWLPAFGHKRELTRRCWRFFGSRFQWWDSRRSSRGTRMQWLKKFCQTPCLATTLFRSWTKMETSKGEPERSALLPTSSQRQARAATYPKAKNWTKVLVQVQSDKRRNQWLY